MQKTYTWSTTSLFLAATGSSTIGFVGLSVCLLVCLSVTHERFSPINHERIIGSLWYLHIWLVLLRQKSWPKVKVTRSKVKVKYAVAPPSLIHLLDQVRLTPAAVSQREIILFIYRYTLSPVSCQTDAPVQSRLSSAVFHWSAAETLHILKYHSLRINSSNSLRACT